MNLDHERWRLKSTIYKTSQEAQAAVDKLEAEYAVLPFEQKLDCKILPQIMHTTIIRDLLKEQENG